MDPAVLENPAGDAALGQAASGSNHMVDTLASVEAGHLTDMGTEVDTNRGVCMDVGALSTEEGMRAPERSEANTEWEDYAFEPTRRTKDTQRGKGPAPTKVRGVSRGRAKGTRGAPRIRGMTQA